MNDSERQEMLRKLDCAVLMSRNIFKSSIGAKLNLLLKHPIFVMQRKVIVGFLGQKKHFTLKAKTFWGTRMYVNNYEPYLWFCGILAAPAEIRLTKYFIKNLSTAKQGHFFDVGAHHGFYTLLADAVSGHTMKIESFEPAEPHYSIMKRNSALCTHARAHQLVVCSRSGSIDFYESTSTVSSIDIRFSNPKIKFNKVTLLGVSIDDFCRVNKIVPAYIKIDVERAEGDVIKGAIQILRKYRPIIAMEVISADNADHNDSHKEAIDILVNEGYKPFRISDEGNLIAASIADAQSISSEQGFDNFIFKK